MHWINYQHLFYFWHVARCGSVTEAAQQLRLAQPTISAQLKSLEAVLGEKLFEREGRGLRLTEAGLLTSRYAEQIFSTGEELLSVLKGKAEGISKPLNVGIADVVPKSLAYTIIQPAFSGGNAVTVHCFEDKTERLLAQLSISEVDLVIADRPLPPNVKVKAFNHFIGECGVSFLGVRSITKKLKSGFPGTLNVAPLLLPTKDSAVRHELDRWFDKMEITPQCKGEFQDRALMKLAAKDGKGIMPIPTVVEDEVRKECNLDLLGRSTEVNEQVYLISVERRLRNPVVMKICTEGQRRLFSRRYGGK